MFFVDDNGFENDSEEDEDMKTDDRSLVKKKRENDAK